MPNSYNISTHPFDETYHSYYNEIRKTFRTTNGAGGTLFSIELPVMSSAFIEVVLQAKLEGSDEFYVELITYRAYRGASGNVVNMSGATLSLSENFTNNPTRAVTVTPSLFVLNVGSGVVQNVNWIATVRYKIEKFTS